MYLCSYSQLRNYVVTTLTLPVYAPSFSVTLIVESETVKKLSVSQSSSEAEADAVREAPPARGGPGGRARRAARGGLRGCGRRGLAQPRDRRPDPTSATQTQ